MYTIYVLPGGSCKCEGKLQDSTARWEEPNLADAVKSMKMFAQAGNGMKIKKRDIEILMQRQVMRTEWVAYRP